MLFKANSFYKIVEDSLYRDKLLKDCDPGIVKLDFIDYDTSIARALEKLNFEKKLEKIKKIIIKPNLLQDAPPPCTTDVRCVEAFIKYVVGRKSDIELVIIEGSGGCNTERAYEALGYKVLEKRYRVRLVDVDNCELVRLENKDALAYKEIYLPSEALDGFFVSIPSLKSHSITKVTLGLKNLIGLLPKKYYGRYLSYNRSDVHRVGVNRAIVDLNRYIRIDMSIIDGRIGQLGTHLPGGKHCSPPKNIIIAGYNCLEVDKVGARVLGYEWCSIEHLTLFEKSRK